MTTAIVDYRRSDLRTSVLENMYWITSAEFDYTSEDKVCVVFSFPAAIYTRGLVLIHTMCIQITTNFAGGTITVDTGAWTLATDDVTTAGVATEVDDNEYIDNTDVTHGTKGYYFPDGGDYLTVLAAQTWAAPAVIVPADSTVPVIGVLIASNTTSSAGAGRIHMLISELPGV